MTEVLGNLDLLPVGDEWFDDEVAEEEEVIEEEVIEEVIEEEVIEEEVVDEVIEEVIEEKVVEEPASPTVQENVVVEKAVTNEEPAPPAVAQAVQARMEKRNSKRLEQMEHAQLEQLEEEKETTREESADEILLDKWESTLMDLDASAKQRAHRISVFNAQMKQQQEEQKRRESLVQERLQKRLDDSSRKIEEENRKQAEREAAYKYEKERQKAEKKAKKEEQRLKREAYEKRKLARKKSVEAGGDGSLPPELMVVPGKVEPELPEPPEILKNATPPSTPSAAPTRAPPAPAAPAPAPKAPVSDISNKENTEPVPKKQVKGDQSSSFEMAKAQERREEHQKLKMAGFLRELQKLAKEQQKQDLRDSLHNAQEVHKQVGGSISLEDIEDLSKITPEVAMEKVEALLEGRGKGDNKLDSESLLKLQQAATQVMGELETLIDLRDRGFRQVTVVGDLHGSLDCLKCVLELVGLDKSGKNKKDDQVILFAGDYVDRGEHSLEVICTLLILKLAFPETVYMIRGNHEDTMTASIYGFRDEIGEKYDDPDVAEEIWYEFGTLFASIPIVAWTKQAAIMHGGIPSKGFSLERVKAVTPDVRIQLKTVVDPYDEDEEVVQGVMWSDPTSEPGICPNDRGGGSIFGPDIAKDFLDRHDLRYIIRAHEPFEEGTDHVDAGDGKAVVTIFSASNYPNGEGTNLGAVLHLDEESGEYTTVPFDSSNRPKGEASDGSEQYKRVLKMYVDHNRSRLTRAFRGAQVEDGKVTTEKWAEVVAAELELPDVDWLRLQPQLAPAEDCKIDWGAFLNNYSSKIPNKGMLDDDQLSILHEQKDKFLNIFQLLDADGSGTIDKQEFVQGITALNQQSGAEAQLKDPEKLWKLFDIDGDGEIDIEEFCKGLEASATMQNIANNLDSKQVESLQENHEMLLLAFKYLDTDGGGSIDREEFRVGVNLLNKRLPERNQLGDPDELFDLLDADGSGDIDINEFNAMFQNL